MKLSSPTRIVRYSTSINSRNEWNLFIKVRERLDSEKIIYLYINEEIPNFHYTNLHCYVNDQDLHITFKILNILKDKYNNLIIKVRIGSADHIKFLIVKG